MKIITLVPSKNEALIIDNVLAAVSQYSDHIIVADQMSSDGTRDICKRFDKVKLINNPNTGHSNRVRFLLLDAARQFDGNNLILFTDADEYFPPVLFNRLMPEIMKDLKPRDILAFLWIQLWKEKERYNWSAPWKNNFKHIGFVDDRKVDFDRDLFVVNDHLSRIPDIKKGRFKKIKGLPLIHLQWYFWELSQIKQAWYRCMELVKDRSMAKMINYGYRISLDNPHSDLRETNPSWIEGIDLPGNNIDMSLDWRYKEIISLFDKYGVEYFEPLQIWHVAELCDEFRKRTGRAPCPKVFSGVEHIMTSGSIFMKEQVAGRIKRRLGLIR